MQTQPSGLWAPGQEPDSTARSRRARTGPIVIDGGPDLEVQPDFPGLDGGSLFATEPDQRAWFDCGVIQ